MMAFYSAVLALSLLLSSPWWIARMLTTERYREGLRERLGTVPERLKRAVAGYRSPGEKCARVVWVHAVSVGEVLAASRLVGELETALSTDDATGRVVISTTTRTGQALASERFGTERVFYFPLDFAWAVRSYLRVLQPSALVLMESELWPRMLHECSRAGVPVVVVNARMSDRSFARAMKVRALWARVLRRVSLWLAQSDEDARRLVAVGARADSVRAVGNLKYDVRAPKESVFANIIRDAVAGRPIFLAGSTAEGEEEIVVSAFYQIWAAVPNALMIIAPRHPERFARTLELAEDFGAIPATKLLGADAAATLRQTVTREGRGVILESTTLVVVLDTIGDLASMYRIAHLAFVGGSMVPRGGQNPLEAAQFGTAVLMGPSYQNFHAVVEELKHADAIAFVRENTPAISITEARLATDPDTPHAMRDALAAKAIELLKHPDEAHAMGERARRVFEEQQGATKRTVEAIVQLVRTGPTR